MSSKTYTPTIEQINATKIGMNISLSANAGAGKTSVLVDRYLKLLLSGIKVNEIVAITFTKKAANEMIERIANNLDELIEDAVRNNEDTRNYKKIRKHLSSANISTIHSFCLDILKDYVIEADLEPNFRELTDIEKLNIIEDAVDIVFEEIASVDTEEDVNWMFPIVKENNLKTELIPLLDKLFTFYHRKDIVNIIELLLKKTDLEEDLDYIDTLTFDEWNKQIIEVFYDNTKNDVNMFIENIKEAMCIFDEIKFTNDNKDKTYSLVNEIINYNTSN